ncbi:MAG: LiaI-LiaF-like domain-containing protein [Anaerolineae bacterium]
MENPRQTSRRQRLPSLFWPVILITAGVLFLLDNLGMLNVNFWQLWRLWPIVLILAGLDILVASRSWLGNLFVLALTLAVIAGVVILILTAPQVLGPIAEQSLERVSEPLDGVERAHLEIDFTAGQLSIGRLEDSPLLVEGELKLATQTKPVWQAERSAGQANLSLRYKQSYQSWSRGDEWTLRLSPRVGFSLEVNVGAGGATFDLTGLDIQALKVKSGVSGTRILFPARGQFSAEITGGVGALDLEVPEDMAVRLEIDRGIGAVHISDRFKKEGAEFVTGDWASNPNRIDLKIQVGIGAVTVREP